MARPSLYLDECVHTDLIPALRKRGFTVTSARDEGLANRHIPDDAQLDYATQRGCAIITYNGDEFLRLHHHMLQQGRTHAGIIVMPDRGRHEVRVLRVAMMVDWVADTFGDPRSQFFYWGQLQQLLQRGVRLSGYSDEDIGIALGR